MDCRKKFVEPGPNLAKVSTKATTRAGRLRLRATPQAWHDCKTRQLAEPHKAPHLFALVLYSYYSVCYLLRDNRDENERREFSVTDGLRYSTCG
jgi:hypothetical protein